MPCLGVWRSPEQQSHEIYMKVDYSEISSAAISLIETLHLCLDSGTNYRLQKQKHKKLYHARLMYATDAIWNSILALVPEATMTEGAFVTINKATYR